MVYAGQTPSANQLTLHPRREKKTKYRKKRGRTALPTAMQMYELAYQTRSLIITWDNREQRDPKMGRRGEKRQKVGEEKIWAITLN